MSDRAVLLTPGAGTAADHPSLLALEAALAPIPVVRHDFPYRRAGRKAPDRAPKLVADVVEAATALAEATGLPPERIVLGGRSMGSRMCSMAVAEGLPALGLVLLAYPLHPAGKPDKLRIEHLPQITVPTLAISGTRDPFGTPDELTEHLSTIPDLTLELLDGARHGLERKDEEVAEMVATWIRRL